MTRTRVKEIRMRCAVFLVLLAVLPVAGCATHSGHPRYYTLDMRASNVEPCQWNLRIEQLVRAEPLLRPNLLIKKDPIEVEYYALEHWASGVDDLIREKLEMEFGPHRSGAPTLCLSGQVLAFEQVDLSDGAEAHAKMRISFRTASMKRHEEPLYTGLYEASQRADSATPGAVVTALSRCLEVIAADLIADARGLSLPEEEADVGRLESSTRLPFVAEDQ